ncbi:MAG: hypothetical protein K9J76_06040 [Polaromonas sp.]|nr:hypothetical protein [Polaromonas sp.]
MTNDDMAFPPLSFEEESPRVMKPPLREEDVIEQAFETIRSRHPRIAGTLKTIWGYQECSDYLQKLVFNGSDPTDLKRAGFDPEVADALLQLSRMHKVDKS